MAKSLLACIRLLFIPLETVEKASAQETKYEEYKVCFPLMHMVYLSGLFFKGLHPYNMEVGCDVNFAGRSQFNGGGAYFLTSVLL
jgi:hypothetical protein